MPSKRQSAQESGAPLPYTVRFSRRRRTLALAVTLTGEVVVHAPAGTPEAAIRQVLARHHPWLARKVAARQAALAAVIPGCAYYLGEPLPVRLQVGAPPAVVRAGDHLEVRLPASGADPWPPLVRWYRQMALPYLQARAAHFAPRLGKKVGAVELRDWRSRWGECRPAQGLLRFHWRLILLPPPLVDYVVVHELAHLTVPGHPPRFWAAVAGILPDWQDRRRRLNGEAAPFLHWRLQL
ncbi:MAG: M48 family metallopeptidase [Syntrophobacterales bacterium]|nr:M48 family metallopeptidase [Syntrophobacterales bacterium]